MLTIICILLFILIGGSIVFYSVRYGISPMPSSRKARNAVLELIPTHIQGKIVELGSGWGTLAFPLAERFPHCQVEAYEISPVPWLVSFAIQQWKRYPNLQIIRRDFFTISLEDANVIVCYLYPGAMRKLKEKFEKELAPGTLIISHTFAISGWKPVVMHKLSDLYHTTIYLYKQ